ncbi:MAG: hybrid sensor histidine kinase/response regulator [Phototrophicaceae bacterium]
MTKILVIEDEDLLRMTIVDQLTFEGYDVYSASNGLSGIQEAGRLLPDIVVCDIQMPEMDGFGVLENLRSHAETAMIPFIFLTAFAQQEYMRKGMNIGADDFLSKPFSASELRLAIEARLKRKRMAEQDLKETKLKLAKTLSHELRTPLVPIYMASEMIHSAVESFSLDELRQLNQSILNGGRRLNRAVDQTILYFQLESGLINEEVIAQLSEPINVESLLNLAIEQARKEANKNRRLPILLTITDSFWVKGVANLLQSAMTEIILNSLQYSSANGRVEIEVMLDPKDGVLLTITDHGIGIPTSQLDRVTEPFTQIDRDLHEQQGLGLGLTISHHIITLHGGKIGFKSYLPVGTVVYVTLPLHHT